MVDFGEFMGYITKTSKTEVVPEILYCGLAKDGGGVLWCICWVGDIFGHRKLVPMKVIMVPTVWLTCWTVIFLWVPMGRATFCCV